MNRDHSRARMAERQTPFDIVVIGGGATGAGIALDAASRNLDVLLLERDDFGTGTSSRSTKIIHGGVRYLTQGRIGLVREALRERATLFQNAPHLVSPLAFFVPIENTFQRAKYYAGLKLYDALAGKRGVNSCTWLGQDEFQSAAASVQTEKFSGAMRYFDGQFDDTRLLINIVATAAESGAIVLNYAEVTSLNKDRRGRIKTVSFCDRESGSTHEVRTKAVVNASGVASDAVLRLDQPSRASSILPSQGAHIVIDKAFLPNSDALLMPRTPDGRIMFAIPWLGHVLIGTTDTPLPAPVSIPVPKEEEIEMILNVSANYLRRAPTARDILSSFAGIRPLVRVPTESKSSKVSREHRIDTLPSGLVSISGGKWTTYRIMAEQCVDTVCKTHGLQVPKSQTRTLKLLSTPAPEATPRRFEDYGTNARELEQLIENDPGLDAPLCDDLPYKKAHCVWAIQNEMARTIEDILARRTRALFLNARSALQAAPAVLDILTQELALEPQAAQQQLQSFTKLAIDYGCQ